MTEHPAHSRRPTRPHPAAGGYPGFTMIELLVAVSVLSLMLGLAARIFYDAQSAVGRGMETSQIIAEQRAVSQPFAEDFRNMHVYESAYGGNTPGFLAIVQQGVDGVRYPPLDDSGTDPATWVADRDGDGVLETLPNFDDAMRSDQIAFFRDAQGLNALTPGGEDRYDSQARALNARVWYGHTWPSDVTPNTINQDAPGSPGYDLATQMVMGRQALLLVENNGGTTYPSGDSGETGVPPSPLAANDDNRVATSGTLAPNFRVNNVTYLGRFDTFDLNTYVRNNGAAGGTNTYSVYDDGGTDPAGINPSALFRTPTYDIAPAADESYFGGFIGAGGLPNAGYANAVREWTYANPGRRLRATTYLENDFSAGIFTADDIARLHAAFSPHLADFAIEFAADWHDDLDPDDFNGNNDYTEPDGLPDGEPDRDRAGNIVWYTALDPNPDNTADDPTGAGPFDGIGNNRPGEAVTYSVPDRVPAFDGTAGPPSVDVEDTFLFNSATDSMFVWSHTGPSLDDDPLTAVDETLQGCGKYWPYLVRIRYRLMDGDGDFRSVNPVTGQPVVGRWFEQILIVPRPQGLF